MNFPLPTPDQLADAAANVYDTVFRGGLADLRRTPASIIEEQPQCTVYRYLVPDETRCRELPLLLVPRRPARPRAARVARPAARRAHAVLRPAARLLAGRAHAPARPPDVSRRV